MAESSKRLRNGEARQLGPGDDLEMISHPDLWPHICYLPVKNHAKAFKASVVNFPGLPGTGVIVAHKLTTVYIGLLFLMPVNFWEDPTIEKIEYASVEAMLADGWRVD